MISAAAATLSAFARPGDRLWTPALVDSARVPGADGVEFVSGPLDGQATVLAWGETATIEALRRPGAAPSPDAEWTSALWLQHPSAEAAARCNHRGFAHALAAEIGVALPGARMMDEVDQIESHVQAGGAGESTSHTWIVKAPYSASGRERLRHSVERALTEDRRTRLERLFESAPVLFEPWVDRIVEVATAGVIGPSGTTLLPTHRLETDDGGVFRGIVIECDPDSTAGLEADELQRVRATANACAKALWGAGYRGPFGVDAYAYRAPDGSRKLAPLGEINARLTFGHVAHAHAARLGWDVPVRFVLGRRAPPADAVPLVLPAADEPTAAWLEPAARPWPAAV